MVWIVNELVVVFRENFVLMSIYNSQLYWNDWMTILCAVPVATCNLIGPKWSGRIGAPAHA